MGHFTAFLNNFINCGLFFLSLGRHAIPAIHCLLTNKDEELKGSPTEDTRNYSSTPTNSVMSDWEQATRNAEWVLVPLYPSYLEKNSKVWFSINIRVKTKYL